MFYIRKMFVALVAAVFGVAVSAQAFEGPDKVLFVGNSFSFYNNGVHNQTANLVRASGAWKAGKNRYRLLTLSGGKLAEHEPILSGYFSGKPDAWDMVVVQGHSAEPLGREDETGFRKSARALVQQIRSAGAQPVLFMTWAYGNKPGMIKSLSEAYLSLGKELDVPVVPVGEGFARAQQLYPDINLFVADVRGVKDGELAYRKDLKHPSVAGTYLAACMFYTAFTGQSPVGNIYRAGLSEQTASKLQAAAYAVVSESR